MNIAARLISYLFHPLLLATYSFALLSFTLPSLLEPIQISAHLNFVFLILIVTFLLPVALISFLKISGIVSSFTMQHREERLTPFVLITILYCGFTYLFFKKYHLNLDDNIFRIIVIIDMLVLLATLVTFFYKVSIHSLAIWGLLGIIIPLNRISENNALVFPTVLILILAGFIMSSRLQLQAHNPREVLVGMLAGFIASLASMYMLF